MGFLTANAIGERDVLKTFVLHQLAQLRTTVHGLNDEQAHAKSTVSAFNLTGLLLHGATTSAFWTTLAADAPKAPQLPEFIGYRPHPAEQIGDDRPLEEVLVFFDRCVEFAATSIDRIDDMGRLVPKFDAPWLPADLEGWEVRWCLAHLTAEIARHVGHADIIRESTDGKVSFELNDAVDGTDYAQYAR